MAQVSRKIRKAYLRLLPPEIRRRFLARYPNLRKSAPDGIQFVFDHYLGDIRVNVDTHFTVEKYMWTGCYDAGLTTLLRRHVRPGHVCIDVGANAGPITLLLARQVGDDGRVVAVEAAPPTYRRLLANLSLNPMLSGRVKALNIGAGRESGTLYWNEESDNPGNGWLGTSGTESVRIVTLDSIVHDNALDRLDFIKIDVEGMEYDVFLGARGSLQRFQPMVFFETLARFKNSGGKGNFDRIAQLLSELDYELYRLGRSATLTKTTVNHLGANTVAISRSNAGELAR